MKLPALVDVTCKQVVELISDYLTTPGLGTRDRARFEQHLYACTWCMDYLQQVEATRRAASNLPEVAELPETELLALFRRSVASAAAEPAKLLGTPSSRRLAGRSSLGSRAEAPRRATRRSGRRLAGVRFAFKFLQPDGLGPLTNFAWPLPSAERPGAWVDVARPLAPCRVGVHACSALDLSSWLHEALYLVELGGDVRLSIGGVVATRGRLVREIEGWRRGGSGRFAHAAYQHALELAEAATPERRAAAAPCLASAAYHLPNLSFALAAFCSAMSVARLHGSDHFEQVGYDAERRWQSQWIARDLQLDALLATAAQD
jgi:hypothetical protein